MTGDERKDSTDIVSDLYARIYFDIFENPKMLSVSVLAQLVYIKSFVWSRKMMTDGVITPSAIAYFMRGLTKDQAKRIKAELLREDLWRARDSSYIIVDYLSHQDSKEKILARKKQNSENRRKGLPPSPLSESTGDSPPNISDSEKVPW